MVGPRLSLNTVLGVSVRVSVAFGRAGMRLEERSGLTSGSILQLDREKGELLEVSVAGKIIAYGEAVIVDGRRGVRIVRLACDLAEANDHCEDSKLEPIV